MFRGKANGLNISFAKQGEDFDKFFAASFSDIEVITMLFLTLNLQLNQVRLKSVHLNQYWNSVLHDGKREIQQ